MSCLANKLCSCTGLLPWPHCTNNKTSSPDCTHCAWLCDICLRLLPQVRRLEMEAEHKRQDELKHQAEAAKEAERKAKYELALAREEERKMVRHARVGWRLWVYV